MISTLTMIRSIAVKTADEAIDLMFNQQKRSVVLYASSDKTLSAEIQKLYAKIKEHNANIEDINPQILPTNPYCWDDIDGCLAVQCAEISGGTFADNADKLAPFSGWNYDVLSNSSARKPLSAKAMSSLAMLGYLATH